MSTVKRAAGYEEENQQAEQIANEMFQVSFWNPYLRNPRACEILESVSMKIAINPRTEIQIYLELFSNTVGETLKHLLLLMKNSKLVNSIRESE